jgi:hypothetical protein
MKYNITSNDGDSSSITVFMEDGSAPMQATADHPKFAAIVEACKCGFPDDEIRGLFDRSIPLAKKFDRLSERVLVNSGRIFFDGMEVHNSLAETIVGFQDAGLEDFMPLVNFMEKIETNPSQHSREHLFRWLTNHRFSLHPDGDFIAYKGVQSTGKSSHAGNAIVNNEWIDGNIPNAPGTIIEMPRDQVTFDPSNGCSVGLHAGNWRYASTFAAKVMRVKINPRDVVSVPVDSNDEKLRVCRYRVLDHVTTEDKTLLFLGDIANRTAKVEPKKAEVRAEKKAAAKAPAKKHAPRGQEKVKPVAAPKAAAAPAPKVKFPRYYEQMKAEHFAALDLDEAKWLMGEWGIKPWSKMSRRDIVRKLAAEATERLKTWKK